MAQAGLTRLLSNDVGAAWSHLDIQDLKTTLPRFKAIILSLINRYGLMSSSMAVDYYRQARRDAGISGRITVPTAPLPAVDQVSTSVDWATKGLWSTTPDTASAQTLVTGSAEKMVLDSGRDTIITAVQSDRRAKGWARVPEPDCCAFCAMLATRGAVYKTAETADFKSHDHCRCHVEPVFTHYEPTAQIRQWESLYSDSTRGQKDKLNAFRRAFESQSPGATD